MKLWIAEWQGGYHLIADDFIFNGANYRWFPTIKAATRFAKTLQKGA